ncbi:hypothetical protein CN296_20925 [Bacillus cereus]|nr:hypothetical protein CN296_20925 [Bacillus cereus]
MRSCTKVIKKYEQVLIQKFAVNEEFTMIAENKNMKKIEVSIEYKDVNDIVIGNETHMIMDGKYDLLMSDSSQFAPDKRLNEYRESDLWYIIDQIREEYDNGLI